MTRAVMLGGVDVSQTVALAELPWQTENFRQFDEQTDFDSRKAPHDPAPDPRTLTPIFRACGYSTFSFTQTWPQYIKTRVRILKTKAILNLSIRQDYVVFFPFSCTENYTHTGA